MAIDYRTEFNNFVKSKKPAPVSVPTVPTPAAPTTPPFRVVNRQPLAPTKPRSAASFFLPEFAKTFTNFSMGIQKATKLGSIVTAPIEAFGSKRIRMFQENEQKANQAFQDHQINRLRNPNISVGEKAQIKETLLKSIDSNIKNNAENLKIATPETTAKDVGASALQLSALALSGLNMNIPGGFGMVAARNVTLANKVANIIKDAKGAAAVAKYGNVAGKLVNAFKYIPTALKDTAIGTGILASGELAQGQKPNLGRDLKIGGALSAAGPVLGLLAKGAGAVIKKTGLKGAVTSGIERGITGLERAATRRVDEYGTVLPRTFRERAAQATLNTINTIKDIPRKYFDPNYPFAGLQNKIRQATGKPLTEEQLLYVNADRVGKLAPSVAQEQLDKYFGRYSDTGRLLEPGVSTAFRDIAPQTQQRINLLEQLGRVQQGHNVSGGVDFTAFRVGSPEYRAAQAKEVQRITGQLTEHQATNAANEQRIQQATENFKQFNRQQLDLDVAAGLKDKKTADLLFEQNPYYYAHQIPELIDPSLGTLGRSNAATKQVGQSGLKSAEGSSRAVEAPFNSMADNTLKMNIIRERNVFDNQLVDAQEKFNIIPGMTPTRTASQIEEQRAIFGQMDVVKANREALREQVPALQNLNRSANKEVQGVLKTVKTAEDKTSALYQEARARAADMESPGVVNRYLKASQMNELKVSDAELKLATATENQAGVKEALDVLKSAIKEQNKGLGELSGALRETRLPGKEAGDLTFSFYRRGIKETWIIPKDQESLYKALTGVDNPTMNGLMKGISAINNIFKGLATRFSPSFLISNLARDQQTRVLLMNSFIKEMTSLTGAKPVAQLAPDVVDALFRVNRSMQSSLLREGKPSESIKALTGTQSIGRRILTFLRPDHAIEKVNNLIESSTRKGVFESALKAGLSPKVAGYISDSVTTDFSKIAPGLREVNQVIPFLNPRIQGALNLAKGFQLDATGVMRKLVLTAGYPTIVLDKWNKQFPSYANISTQEKDNYWIIMIGEEKNSQGNGIADYVKFRKGEGQSLFANALRYALEKGSLLDQRTTGKAVTDIISSVSPINVGGNASNPALSIASSLGGPLTNTIGGLASNTNPYTGVLIVPQNRQGGLPEQQYGASNSQTLIDIAKTKFGKALHMSPATTEFVLGSIGAGTAKDILLATDAARSLLNNGKLQTKSPTNSVIGILSKLPVSRSFVGQIGGENSPQVTYDKKVLGDIAQQNTAASIATKQKAEALYVAMKQTGSEKAAAAFIEQHKAEFTPEIIKAIGAVKTKDTVKQESLSYLSAVTDSDSRAQFIEWKIWSLVGAGVGPEEVQGYVNDLQKSGFLTQTILGKIKQLQNQRK